MKIEADLPFTFCKECKRRELEEGRLYNYQDEVISGNLYCKRAGICKNAIEMYQQYLDDGRQIYEKE